MKRLRWGTIFVGCGVLMILVGAKPVVHVLWRAHTHNSEVLSVPVLLKPGEYVSPLFTPDTNDDYQIEIYFLPAHRAPLDIDWAVVDEAGKAIQNGAYSEGGRMGGNDAILQRHYWSKRRQRQRLILNVKRDIQQASVSDTRLHVGVPERGLEQAYGSAAALKWLLFFAGPGTIILIVFAMLRLLPRRDP